MGNRQKAFVDWCPKNSFEIKCTSPVTQTVLVSYYKKYRECYFSFPSETIFSPMLCQHFINGHLNSEMTPFTLILSHFQLILNKPLQFDMLLMTYLYTPQTSRLAVQLAKNKQNKTKQKHTHTHTICIIFFAGKIHINANI